MLLGLTQSGIFCYGRADFLLRGSGFSVALTEKNALAQVSFGIIEDKKTGCDE